LLPNDSYRRLWSELTETFKPYDACRLMVEAPYLAATRDKEYLIGLWMEGRLRDGTLTFRSLQEQFADVPAASLTVNTVEQHPLEPYDRLLNHDSNRYRQTGSVDPPTIPAPAPHDTTVAGVRVASAP
jgi:hypothetical protein